MKLYLLAHVVCLLLSFHVKADVFTFVVAGDEPPLSSMSEGKVVGVIPDIINLIFSYLPAHQVTLKAFPWARAQVEVERGRADGLLTYPSISRKDYVSFTSNTVYKLDFGYLIYHRGNTKRDVIESATSFEDLKGVTVITQTGAEWESDNIPDYIHKVEANKIDTMFHLLLLRKQGDFLIMLPEQAIYKASTLGYPNKIAYRQVNFISDSLISFHIGLRKSHPLATDFISEVDAVVGSEQFLKEVQKIVSSYR
jgi:polar amino acid transport system substrate-binding protein|tara:strand:+ start:990 stop:1748 length:759 start_codon:yes stop_codon:yes gene_type:complete